MALSVGRHGCAGRILRESTLVAVPSISDHARTIESVGESEIGHDSALPEEWVDRAVCRFGGADNLTGIIDAICSRELAAQSAEVDHFALFPKERARSSIAELLARRRG